MPFTDLSHELCLSWWHWMLCLAALLLVDSMLTIPKTSTMNLRAMREYSRRGFMTKHSVRNSLTPLMLTRLASPSSSSFSMAVTLTKATPKPCCTAPLIASTELSSCNTASFHHAQFKHNTLLTVCLLFSANKQTRHAGENCQTTASTTYDAVLLQSQRHCLPWTDIQLDASKLACHQASLDTCKTGCIQICNLLCASKSAMCFVQ